MTTKYYGIGKEAILIFLRENREIEYSSVELERDSGIHTAGKHLRDLRKEEMVLFRSVRKGRFTKYVYRYKKGSLEKLRRELGDV